MGSFTNSLFWKWRKKSIKQRQTFFFLFQCSHSLSFFFLCAFTFFCFSTFFFFQCSHSLSFFFLCALTFFCFSTCFFFDPWANEICCLFFFTKYVVMVFFVFFFF